MKKVLRKIFKKQRHPFLGALFVLAAALAGISIFLWWKLFVFEPGMPQAIQLSDNQSAATSTLARRPIDGALTAPEQASSSLFAVMIDNLPESRPAAGLSQALLVWEAPVEGGMSRFLAVFVTSTDLARVGPVRSARPYYLDWAKELNALYLHCGGSDQSLAQINGKDIFDLNEFYRPQYFWRDHNRLRPYNIYTSTELVNQAFENESGRQHWQPQDLDSWLFKKEETPLAQRGEGQNIQLDFGKLMVEWKYNRENNLYERWEDGDVQKDESGAVITAKNVILQYTSIVILDEVGRRQIKTIGAGKAVIYRDGREVVGTWQKKSLTDRTRFFGPDTKEIEFNAGVTWVEVADRNMNSEF